MGRGIHEPTYTKADAPPSYLDVMARSASEQRIASTAQLSTGEHQPCTVSGEEGIKVSSMPRHAPPSSSRYISVMKPNMSERGAMHYINTILLWPWRFIECRVNTYRAKRVVKHDTNRTSSHNEEHGGGAPIPPDGIGPGEIERSVNNAYDWTCDWSWQMSLMCGDSSNRWVAWVCIYLNDLPYLLSTPEPLPWTDPSRTQKVRGDTFPRCHDVIGCPCHRWQCTFLFRERGPHPRWGARIVVRHCDRGEIVGIDPWAFVTSALTEE